MRKANIRILILLLLSVAAVGAYADNPGLPPGLGKYIMVLWPAGAPIPGDPKGTVKNIPEPDVAKLGGSVLLKDQNRRVILLPLGQAKGLRKHEAVAYLQRVWMGEPLAGWDETYPASAPSALRHTVETDPNIGLHWGPKAYQYDGSGNIVKIGEDDFVYDPVSRLISAEVSGATIAPKTETYGYDAFGNLIQRGVTGSNPVSIPVDGGSNRLLGVPYDAAGNITAAENGRRSYTWDSVNTLSRVHPSIGNERRMIYDASDERIGTYLVGDSLTRWTIRDFNGQNIREFEAYHYSDGRWAWLWDQDNFYGEGILLAGQSQPLGQDSYGGPRHYHLDHLGSVRMVTNGASPGRALSEHDYYPFGTTATRTYQEEIDWVNNHIDGMRFAGQWRDYLGLLNVDNTDYIDFVHARHYDPNLGRFLSVDPVLDQQRALKNPQEWNRYSYVGNNPMNKTDPDGKETNPVTGSSGISDDELRTNHTNPHVGHFGHARSESNWNGGYHNGVDIRARAGTPIYAPISGTVTVATTRNGGNIIYIDGRSASGEVVRIGMAHLQAVNVRTGDTVVEGQPGIATSGDTGNARGLPVNEQHVHLTVRVGQTDSEPVNPQPHFHDNPATHEWDHDQPRPPQ